MRIAKQVEQLHWLKQKIHLSLSQCVQLETFCVGCMWLQCWLWREIPHFCFQKVCMGGQVQRPGGFSIKQERILQAPDPGRMCLCVEPVGESAAARMVISGNLPCFVVNPFYKKHTHFILIIIIMCNHKVFYGHRRCSFAT